MRCCNCPFEPILDGYDVDECTTDACWLVSEDEVTEYYYKGRFEIGCKFNLPTLKKRKERLDASLNDGSFFG